jgi:hypothetical protein
LVVAHAKIASSILLHAVIDAFVGYMSAVKANIWLIEGVNLLVGIFALVFILKTRSSVGSKEDQVSTTVQS